MPTIKFSQAYTKLLSNINGKIISSALLVDVRPVLYETLHKEFIDYDTDNGKYSDQKRGEFLMLIFLKAETYHEPANLFTTLRRKTLQKELYYSAMIGQTFKIEITAA